MEARGSHSHVNVKTHTSTRSCRDCFTNLPLSRIHYHNINPLGIAIYCFSFFGTVCKITIMSKFVARDELFTTFDCSTLPLTEQKYSDISVYLFFLFTAENNDHSSLKRCFALLLRCVSRVCCMYVCVCVWSASYCNLHRHHHDLCCAGEQDRFEVLKSLLYKGHTDTEVNNNHDALKCHISTHTHTHAQSKSWQVTTDNWPHSLVAVPLAFCLFFFLRKQCVPMEI